jgi:hypothetical protein
VLLTGLTGVNHLWDLPRVNYWTRVSLGLGAADQVLGPFGVILLGFV